MIPLHHRCTAKRTPVQRLQRTIPCRNIILLKSTTTPCLGSVSTWYLVDTGISYLGTKSTTKNEGDLYLVAGRGRGEGHGRTSGICSCWLLDTLFCTFRFHSLDLLRLSSFYSLNATVPYITKGSTPLLDNTPPHISTPGDMHILLCFF